MSDIEKGIRATEVEKQVANPTYKYLEVEEKVHGYLSKQFPTIANPAPLGLAAFALTTFILSMFNAGAASNLRGAHGVVMGMALFYGGLVQLLAGMWEFKTGNTFGAVAFSSYGGFWMGYAALFINAFGFLNAYSTGGDPHQLDNDLAVFLLAWCIFTSIMTFAAHRTTLVLMGLLFTVALVFLMLAIHHFCWSRWPVLQQAGGALGIIAAFGAWYGSVASLLTNKNSLIQLPLWPMDDIWRHYGYLPPLEEETPSKSREVRSDTVRAGSTSF